MNPQGQGSDWPSGPHEPTMWLMTQESMQDLSANLSAVIDRVEHGHERVTVIRDGHPAAVILSPDDLAELQETIEVLSDPQALADISAADDSYRRGDVTRGIEAVRRLRG